MPDLAGAPVDSRDRGFLTVRIDQRCYALRTEDVREIIRVPAVARVPQGPEALLGIANLRGSVLPVASLRGLLGVVEAPLSQAARAIVLDVGTPVAVTVDAVDALVTVAADRIQTAQTELGEAPGERLQGLFQTGTDGRAARILDISALLSTAFTQRSPSERKIRHGGALEDGEQAAIEAGNTEMLLTFDVAGQEFALELSAVEEIFPLPAARETVPRAEAVVVGVTSLRGALLPLLSLRSLLGFPPASASNGREKVVVVNVAGARVGLVADHARAIVAAAADAIDPVPAVLAARMGGESRIKGIYRGDGGRRLISILARELLFRDDVIQRLTEHARETGMPTTLTAVPRNADLSVVVFRLGPDEFGLPIDAVEEVAQVPAKIRRVPKTPKFLEGVVNLRGTVLPVIDQRRRFDMPPAEQSTGRRLIVVKTESVRAGLIVDSVSDVLRVPADMLDAPPELTDDISRLVRGVINLEQSARLVLLLDPAELLTRTERGILDRFKAEPAATSS